MIFKMPPIRLVSDMVCVGRPNSLPAQPVSHIFCFVNQSSMSRRTWSLATP